MQSFPSASQRSCAQLHCAVIKNNDHSCDQSGIDIVLVKHTHTCMHAHSHLHTHINTIHTATQCHASRLKALLQQCLKKSKANVMVLIKTENTPRFFLDHNKINSEKKEKQMPDLVLFLTTVQSLNWVR